MSESAAPTPGAVLTMTPDCVSVLTEMLRSPDTPRYCSELARAVNRDRANLQLAMASLCEIGWLADWREDAESAAQEGRSPRRYYLLTEAGAAAARDALSNLPPPALLPVADDAASEAAAQLGSLLREAQKQAKVNGATIAAYAGRSQSWWSKLTAGQLRQPDISALKKIIEGLEVPRKTAERVLALANALNGERYAARVSLVRKGSSAFNAWEQHTFQASELLVSCHDSLPIHLWCQDFTNAMAANLPDRHREITQTNAVRWRERVESGSAIFTWVLGEAALHRTFGLKCAVIVAQLTYMERFANDGVLGIVPFEAEMRTPMQAVRIADEERGVMDLAGGVIEAHAALGVASLVEDFRALPAVWGDDALTLLRRARASHNRTRIFRGDA